MMQKDIQTTWQPIWKNIKKTAKFIWRHFFTLGILGLLLSIFIKDPLNWKNAFYMLCAAIAIDWVKQFIKLTPHSYSNNPFRNESIQPFRKEWGNPSLRGTAANFLSNMDSNRYN